MAVSSEWKSGYYPAEIRSADSCDGETKNAHPVPVVYAALGLLLADSDIIASLPCYPEWGKYWNREKPGKSFPISASSPYLDIGLHIAGKEFVHHRLCGCIVKSFIYIIRIKA